MGNLIKAKLALMDKKHRDLIPELRKRGFPNISASELSRIINGVNHTDMSMRARDTIYDILKDWELKSKTQ